MDVAAVARKAAFAMAAPGFFSPPSVTPSKAKRRFTLEQANRTLPYVSRVVGDIVKAHKQATDLQSKLETLRPGRTYDNTERDLGRVCERLQVLVEELTSVGCELKDYQIGLVDFFGRHQGRDVCLCWRLGEARVNYWHELHTGFAGRQPVSILDERD
jgi:hypothetical protein